MPNVVTVTPNPCVDRILEMDEFHLEAVNRVKHSTEQVAGKGINVSRVLQVLGWPSLPTGFLAGVTGRRVAEFLTDLGLDHHFVQVDGQTRTNIKVSYGGRITEFNEAGPTVTAEAIADLHRSLRQLLQPGDFVVLAGSIPPGCQAGFYKELICHIKQNIPEITVILDASGEPLRQGLEARPDVIKPNRSELEQLAGQPLDSIDAIVGECSKLNQQGVRLVLCSLGGDGLVATVPGAVYRGRSPKVTVQNTVGCGDSLIAGFLASLLSNQALHQALVSGLAAGTAAAEESGTGLTNRDQWARLQTRIELSHQAEDVSREPAGIE